MSIAWKYLNKRAGTTQAIKDYNSMKFIMESTDDEIKKSYEGMLNVGSQQIDGMPHVHNPKAGEERITKGIDEIDVLKERYRQAVAYMEWFQPAWGQLSEDEKFVLRTFYIGEDKYQGSSAVDIVCSKQHIERSSAYNRKNRALNHLSVLLYGKE